jgi:uncharacterized membrane protein YvlD (DUF360 family)
MTILGAIVRFVVSALVLMVVGWLVPGFQVMGFGSALLAALVIAVVGWVVERLFGGRGVSPYARGLVGFLVSVAVIYVTQFFVAGFRVTLLGAVLASLAIGLIDLFVPGDFKGGVLGARGNRDND